MLEEQMEVEDPEVSATAEPTVTSDGESPDWPEETEEDT